MTAVQEIIIAWIAMGMNIKGIAAALHLSEKTVAYHRSAIKKKLGFNDTARLVHWAVSRGLLNLNQTL